MINPDNKNNKESQNENLLATLRGTDHSLHLETEHVLTILRENTLTLQHARKYLNHQYPKVRIDWLAASDAELEKMAD